MHNKNVMELSKDAVKNGQNVNKKKATGQSLA